MQRTIIYITKYTDKTKGKNTKQKPFRMIQNFQISSTTGGNFVLPRMDVFIPYIFNSLYSKSFQEMTTKYVTYAVQCCMLYTMLLMVMSSPTELKRVSSKTAVILNIIVGSE